MDKILFEVNDTENIILGNNLHIPKPGFNGGFEFDWAHESMLVAMEIAYKNGIIIPSNSTEDFVWDNSFNCKINGTIYNVHDTNKKMVIKKIA